MERSIRAHLNLWNPTIQHHHTKEIFSTRLHSPSSHRTNPSWNNEDLNRRIERLTDKLNRRQDTILPDRNYSHMKPHLPDSLHHLVATPATWQELSHRCKSTRESMEIQGSSHLDGVRRRRETEVGNRNTYNIIIIKGGGENSHGNESPESTPLPSQNWRRLLGFLIAFHFSLDFFFTGGLSILNL